MELLLADYIPQKPDSKQRNGMASIKTSQAFPTPRSISILGLGIPGYPRAPARLGSREMVYQDTGVLRVYHGTLDGIIVFE